MRGSSLRFERRETSCYGGPRPLRSPLRSETPGRPLAMVAPGPCVLRSAPKRRGDFLLDLTIRQLNNVGPGVHPGVPQDAGAGGFGIRGSLLRFETPWRQFAMVAPGPCVLRSAPKRRGDFLLDLTIRQLNNVGPGVHPGVPQDAGAGGFGIRGSLLRFETPWRQFAMVAPGPCVLRCAPKRRGDLLLDSTIRRLDIFALGSTPAFPRTQGLGF